MAVNPTDPNNLITGANDEIEEPDCTPSSGGSSSCPFSPTVDTSGVYWSTDGGVTWNHQILHWFSLVGLTSDGDPAVAFGPKPVVVNGKVAGFSYANGARAYFGSLAGNPSFGAAQELIAVAFSDDKGATWSTPVVATNKDNPVEFNDKIAVWADSNPSSPFFGNVYVSWTLFKGNPTLNFGESPTFSPEPIVIARSTDGGQTFQPSVKLSNSANNGAVGGRQGSITRTGPDGTVYVFWDGATNMQSAVLAAQSLDGGVSFSKPFLVSFKSDVPSPFPGARFRVNSFPSADVDQNSGKIFVVWADYTFGATSGHGVVKLATSTDRGNSSSGLQSRLAQPHLTLMAPPPTASDLSSSATISVLQPAVSPHGSRGQILETPLPAQRSTDSEPVHQQSPTYTTPAPQTSATLTSSSHR